jgi:MFS family permease
VAFELVLFIPGGIMLDRLGRFWGTVPTFVLMVIGFAVLPFCTSPWTIALGASILGIGNGLSSGIVMTLGADLSPKVGRPQFLAGWRVFSDTGSTLGPIVISAVTAIATLGSSGLVLAAVGILGAAWLGHQLPLRGTLRPVDAP